MNIPPNSRQQHINDFFDKSKEYQEFKAALKILGDRWSALIIISILEQPQRFGDIEKFAVGISPRTLTQRLKMLEQLGLITRREYKEFPPRTEYAITQKARDLKPVMMELKKWSKHYCN